MDSVYLHVWYVNPLQKFKDFIIANDLNLVIHDVLVGLSDGEYIHRNGFAETIDGGILIEIPAHPDLIIWRTKLQNYLDNHPEITKAVLLTRTEAKSKILTEM